MYGYGRNLGATATTWPTGSSSGPTRHRFGKKGGGLQTVRTRKVLLAEDSSCDVAAFKRAIRKKSARFLLETVTDGCDALAFLHKRGTWQDVWTPDLVVLNIRMPKITGWEVLERMKEDPGLRIIPVAIWTVATIEEYNRQAYEMGAAGIFSKPIDLRDLEAQAAAILEFYWWANPYPWPAFDSECDRSRDTMP